MVKAIIFDLWGTLIENGVYPSPSRQVKYMLRVNYAFPDFIAAFESSFMKTKHESLQVAFEQVVKDFNVRLPSFVYDKLIGMWNKNAILSKSYPEIEEVMKKLREEGYKLFLLANIDPFSWQQVKEKFNLEHMFDKIYLSFETGHLKVEKEAFEEILVENKLKPKDVIMIGDSIDSDVKAAEAVGIRGILVDRREGRVFEGVKIKTLEDLPVLLRD